jgi:hypothetical protein
VVMVVAALVCVYVCVCVCVLCVCGGTGEGEGRVRGVSAVTWLLACFAHLGNEHVAVEHAIGPCR